MAWFQLEYLYRQRAQCIIHVSLSSFHSWLAFLVWYTWRALQQSLLLLQWCITQYLWKRLVLLNWPVGLPWIFACLSPLQFHFWIMAWCYLTMCAQEQRTEPCKMNSSIQEAMGSWPKHSTCGAVFLLPCLILHWPLRAPHLVHIAVSPALAWQPTTRSITSPLPSQPPPDLFVAPAAHTGIGTFLCPWTAKTALNFWHFSSAPHRLP